MGEVHYIKSQNRLNLGDKLFSYNDKQYLEKLDLIKQENDLRLQEAFEAAKESAIQAMRDMVPEEKNFIYFRNPTENEIETIKIIGKYKKIKERVRYQKLHASITTGLKDYVTTGYSGTVSSNGDVNLEKDIDEVTYTEFNINGYSDEDYSFDNYYFIVDKNQDFEEFNSRYRFLHSNKSGYHQNNVSGLETYNGKGIACKWLFTFGIPLTFLLYISLFLIIQVHPNAPGFVSFLRYFNYVCGALYFLLFVFYLINYKRVKEIDEVYEDTKKFTIFGFITMAFVVLAIGLNEPQYWIQTVKDGASVPLITQEGIVINTEDSLVVLLASIGLALIGSLVIAFFIFEIVILILWIKHGYADFDDTQYHDSKIIRFQNNGGKEKFDNVLRELRDLIID